MNHRVEPGHEVERRVEAGIHEPASATSHAIHNTRDMVLGTSVTVPIGSHISALGTTRYCINGGIERYVGLTAGIMTLVFDSLVFLAISYKILTTHTRQGEE